MSEVLLLERLLNNFSRLHALFLGYCPAILILGQFGDWRENSGNAKKGVREGPDHAKIFEDLTGINKKAKIA